MKEPALGLYVPIYYLAMVSDLISELNAIETTLDGGPSPREAADMIRALDRTYRAFYYPTVTENTWHLLHIIHAVSFAPAYPVRSVDQSDLCRDHLEAWFQPARVRLNMRLVRDAVEAWRAGARPLPAKGRWVAVKALAKGLGLDTPSMASIRRLWQRYGRTIPSQPVGFDLARRPEVATRLEKSPSDG